MNSQTIGEIFEEWREQYEEDCFMGQDCQYEDIKPFSPETRVVHFYCENGEDARYDLIEDEEYNSYLEVGEEKKYFRE